MEEYGQLILYKNKDGKKNIEVKLYQDTVWLNQKQLVELFDSSKSNISEHIKHIFEENELDEEIVSTYFATSSNTSFVLSLSLNAVQSGNTSSYISSV